MQLPSHIWQLQGTRTDGPHVVVLGGTHGDEISGIEVVRTILRTLDLLSHTPSRVERDDVVGALSIGFGNPEAMLRCMRSASTGLDLNRSFTIEELDHAPSPEDRVDLRRARELAPFLATADVLIDLHGTSKPSEPFVCFGDATAERRTLCALIPVRYILTDPQRIYTRHEHLSNLGTTDEHVRTRGGGPWSVQHYGEKRGVSLCYESGYAKDTSAVNDVLGTTVKLLAHIGVSTPAFTERLAMYTAPASAPHEQQVYALAEVILATCDGFTYDPGITRGWTPIERDQRIGQYTDGTDAIAPRSGMLLFNEADDRVRKGKKLIWIAERVA